MARRNTPTGLSGILAIDKPPGVTSHDVVDAVRSITGERRVGHAGTLDPLATGLLLVCVGPATRLADYLMVGVKTYKARICFGRATTTDDGEGETTLECELPLQLTDEAFAAHILQGMLGKHEQIPPTFSAIKKDGVAAYKAARTGKQPVLEPRPVELFDATILATGSDFWDVGLTVSKGYYVRSFARDIGRQMNCAAHLGALRRTASGYVVIEQATPLVAGNSSSVALGLLQDPTLSFIDPVAALGLPMIEIDTREAEQVKNGMLLTFGLTRLSACPEEIKIRKTPQTREPQQVLVSIVHDERLLALYETTGSTGLANPKVVIPGGVPR